MTRLSLFLCVAIASPALASDWQSLGTAGDGSVYSLDVQSVRKDGRYASAWVTGDFKAVKTTPYRSSKELWRFDCQERTTLTVSFIAYSANGTVAKSRSLPTYSTSLYTPVAPDTVGEDVMQRICPAE